MPNWMHASTMTSRAVTNSCNVRGVMSMRRTAETSPATKSSPPTQSKKAAPTDDLEEMIAASSAGQRRLRVEVDSGCTVQCLFVDEFHFLRRLCGGCMLVLARCGRGGRGWCTDRTLLTYPLLNDHSTHPMDVPQQWRINPTLISSHLARNLAIALPLISTPSSPLFNPPRLRPRRVGDGHAYRVVFWCVLTPGGGIHPL